MSTVGQISLPGSIYLHYTEDFIFEIMMFACIFAINVQEKWLNLFENGETFYFSAWRKI